MRKDHRDSTDTVDDARAREILGIKEPRMVRLDSGKSDFTYVVCFHCRRLMLAETWYSDLYNIIWSVCKRPECQEAEKKWLKFKRP